MELRATGVQAASGYPYLLLILGGAFLFAYSGVLKTLVNVWWTNSVYSHGFLVPAVSVYLFWTQRHRLNSLKAAPANFSGALLLVLAMLMLVAGNAAGVIFIQELSIIAALCGIFLLIAGYHFLRAFWLPVFYLLFMLRFWEFITGNLHLSFQNLSAWLGTKLLALASIPAYRESVYIELPNITLEVAEVCSGVNYLIAVLAVGIPLSYLTIKSNTRRVLLVTGGVGIAILANGFRVATIGALAFYGFSGPLHGPYHVLQAMFVAVAGFAALIIGAWLLSEREETVREKTGKLNLEFLANSRLPMIIAAVLLSAAGAYINFYSPGPVSVRKDLGSFPYVAGGWKGSDIYGALGKVKELDLDSSITRNYEDASGKRVNLFVGYMESQSQGRELADYKTEELESGGTSRTIKASKGLELNVRRISIGELQGFLWYDIDGHSSAGRLDAKLRTAWSWLFRGRSNGALIAVWWNPKEGTTEEHALEFIGETAPLLREYLP